MSDPRRTYALTLVAQLVGAGAVLLCATRSWQSAVLTRPRPLPAVHVDVTGRTVNALPTALGLVALAGVVAVLAATGLVRRVIGFLVAAAGAGIVAVALTSFPALPDERLRSLARSHHSGVLVDSSATVDVSLHAVWPVLTAVAGLLIALAGALTVAQGARWSGMSRRYERERTDAAPDGSPPDGAGPPGDGSDTGSDPGAEPASGAHGAGADSIALWNSLDRGEDPTRPGGRTAS